MDTGSESAILRDALEESGELFALTQCATDHSEMLLAEAHYLFEGS